MSVYQKTKEIKPNNSLDKNEDYTIFVLDKFGKVENWNDAGTKIFGYAENEILGQPFEILLAKQEVDSKKTNEMIDRTSALGKASEKGLLKRKNGALFNSNHVWSAIYDNDKSIIGFLLIVRDETKQKQLNGIRRNIIAQQNTKQDKKVKDTEEKLEALTKEFELFSYSISHDLSAPLRAINGYVKIIEEDYDKNFDDEGKRLLNLVQKNTKKMSELMDNLLAFSRITTREIKPSEIDTEDLIQGAIFDINKTTDHQAKIIISEVHPIVADFALMHLVFVHLISNAIKFSSKKESPVIEISSEENGGRIVYVVRDNGVGFDMKHYDKLFGVFQKFHDPMEYEGTGMGLAIVKRIIAKHDGLIWAESTPDKGATFYFSLPLNS